jgi:pectate lyase
VDARIVEEVRKGYATYEGPSYEKFYEVADPSRNCGIIDTPSDVGGWPELKSAPAPADTDHDGLPDAWEIANGLNPRDASDRNKVAPDGYTMLEKYLNSLG